MPGVWIVGGLGAFGVIFTFIVGLIPPSFYSNGIFYICAVLLGTFILAVPPLVFLTFRKPSWKEGATKQE